MVVRILRSLPLNRLCWSVVRACQTALAWTAVVLFAATAFFGHGLHLIPGLQHECHAPDCDGHHGVVAACCHHDHEHACEGESLPGEPCCSAPRAASHGHDSRTCPICLFLTTSKALVVEAPPGIRPASAPSQAPYELPCVVSLLERPLGPRGPPAA